jgi:hypothetical protein
MPSDNDYAELGALIAASKRAKIGHGVPEAIIADAEQHLGHDFPPHIAGG